MDSEQFTSERLSTLNSEYKENDDDGRYSLEIVRIGTLHQNKSRIKALSPIGEKSSILKARKTIEAKCLLKNDVKPDVNFWI